jgi:hypothetical protein
VVVFALGHPKEAADSARLAEAAELREPAGEQLMWIRLVPGVPADFVGRQRVSCKKRDGQLDRAEVAGEVAAGDADLVDNRLADLLRELVKAALQRRSERARLRYAF